MFRYIISVVFGLTLMELIIQYDNIEKMVFPPKITRRQIRINTQQLRRTLTLGSNQSNFSTEKNIIYHISPSRKRKRKKSKSKAKILNNYNRDGTKFNRNIKKMNTYLKDKKKSRSHVLVANFSKKVDEIYNEESKNERLKFIKVHSTPHHAIEDTSNRNINNYLDNTHDAEGLRMVKHVGNRKNYPEEDTSTTHLVEDSIDRNSNNYIDNTHNAENPVIVEHVGTRKNYDNHIEDTSTTHLVEDSIDRNSNNYIDNTHNAENPVKVEHVATRKNYDNHIELTGKNIYSNPTEDMKNIHVEENIENTERTEDTRLQRHLGERLGNEVVQEPKPSNDVINNKFLRVEDINDNIQGKKKKENRKKNRRKKRKKKRKKNKKKEMKGKKDKKHTLLAVGILSKLPEIKRRNAIRDTWYRSCVHVTSKSVCRFFTDEIQSDTKNKEVYYKEGREKKDLVYMHSRGVNFSKWLLWMFEWFTEHYEFDFFLRVDDDYFVCFDRLLNELPHRPTGLYWGWVHCQPGIVRVDEAFMILSRDIIELILERVNDTLLCHPFGDQAMASWIYEIENDINVTYFMDNRRLVHKVTSYEGDTYLVPNICNRYLGLHGTYPDYMYKYWQIYSDVSNRRRFGRRFTIPPIIPFEHMCEWRPGLDFYRFHDPFYAVPKPCKYNPVFSRTVFKGREGQTTRKPHIVRHVPDNVTVRGSEDAGTDFNDFL